MNNKYMLIHLNDTDYNLSNNMQSIIKDYYNLNNNDNKEYIQEELRRIKKNYNLNNINIPNSNIRNNDIVYQLDRYIETGTYNLIKTNPKLLYNSQSSYKFYKIRRSLDLGETINESIKKEVLSDKYSYKGIYLRKPEAYGTNLEGPKIIQSKYINHNHNQDKTKDLLVNIIPRDKLKPIKYYFNKNNLLLKDIKNQIYNNNYFYQIFTPEQIFDKGNILNLAFELEEKYLTGYEELEKDSFIKFIDNYELWNSETNKSNKIKIDSLTYEFKTINDAEHTIRISRQKVLRLSNILKKHNLWLDNSNLTPDEKSSSILSIFVKDSIISYYELYELKIIIKSLISDYFISQYKSLNENKTLTLK